MRRVMKHAPDNVREHLSYLASQAWFQYWEFEFESGEVMKYGGTAGCIAQIFAHRNDLISGVRLDSNGVIR